MNEIEVKILEINTAEIRQKLKKIGAKKIFEGEIHAKSFDYPDGRLKKEGIYLRVRKIGDKVELCCKEKMESDSFKKRNETDIEVGNFENMISLLEKLGLKQTFEYKKHRESHKLNNTRFEIDDYPGIPTYLEIEAQTEEEVEKAVKLLGYTMKQTTSDSMNKVIEKYKVGRRAQE